MDCGQGPVTVTPAPFVETGTGLVHRRPRLPHHQRPRGGSGAPAAALGHPRAEEEGHRAGLRGRPPSRPRASCAASVPRSRSAFAARPRTGGSPRAKLKPRPAAHRPALERRQARRRGEEVQRAHVTRQRRAAHARLGPRPGPAAREGRRLSGPRPLQPRSEDRRPRPHPRLPRRRALARAPEPERHPRGLGDQRRRVGREARTSIGQDLVQTDAAASHGNSGGPAITDEATVHRRADVHLALAAGRLHRAGLQLPDPRPRRAQVRGGHGGRARARERLQHARGPRG